MPGHEAALRELEVATAALAEIDIGNIERAQSAMDRRSLAIAAVTELTINMPLNPAERDEILEAMRRACETGEQAQQRLSALRSAAVGELNQWTRLYRALGADGAGGGRIDFTG